MAIQNAICMAYYLGIVQEVFTHVNNKTDVFDLTIGRLQISTKIVAHRKQMLAAFERIIM